MSRSDSSRPQATSVYVFPDFSLDQSKISLLNGTSHTFQVLSILAFDSATHQRWPHNSYHWPQNTPLTFVHVNHDSVLLCFTKFRSCSRTFIKHFVGIQLVRDYYSYFTQSAFKFPRQSGQITWDNNQASIHSGWETWLHFGDNRSVSQSLNSLKHTAH